MNDGYTMHLRCTNEIKELQKENEMMREALEFYDAPKEFMNLDHGLMTRRAGSYDKFEDYFERAREVLAKISKETK
jgi:hypothetical protein